MAARTQGTQASYRAAPPVAPPLTAQQLREHAAASVRPQSREQFERRRQVRGLLLLAVVVLVGSILRFGVHRVFTAGWWHLR